MRVVNICVNGVYTEGYSYQENILPVFQKANGNEVFIIASEFEFGKNGKKQRTDKTHYVNKDGISVYRIPIKNNKDIRYRFKRFLGLYELLEEIKPDVIFCHLFQFLDVVKVIEYKKKNKNVLLFFDNHSDLNNSAKGFLSKKILHGILWKHLAHKALPYAEKFYGVLPARVDFLTDVYKLPEKKCELLLMGADDEKVEEALAEDIRRLKREEYGIKENDIVIMTGGKINANRTQTLKLMEAVNQINKPNVRMLIFGSVTDELKDEFDKQLTDSVNYIGWKNSEDIYKEFAIADLVVFPGLHSVLWEQAVGMGKPCVFKQIKGFDHVDLKGNCLFFNEDSTECYVNTLNMAFEHLEEMTLVAKEKGLKTFSYKNIAKQSIER